jgi:hypothetical protein
LCGSSQQSADIVGSRSPKPQPAGGPGSGGIKW